MKAKKGERNAKAVAIITSTKFKPRFNKKMDGRTAVAKRISSRIAQLVSDQGGLESMSFLRRAMCEKAVFIEALMSELERQWAAGKPIDEGNYRGHLNSLIGLARTLGLDRKSKRLPSVREYINAKSNGATEQ